MSSKKKNNKSEKELSISEEISLAKLEFEKGSIPNTKVIRALKKFAENAHEHFKVEPDISKDMQNTLLYAHKEFSKDGGVNLSPEQLSKIAYAYQKKQDYISFVKSCTNSYYNFLKRNYDVILSEKLGNTVFPKTIKTAEQKKHYILYIESASSEDKNSIGPLIFLLDLTTEIINVYEDELNRSDRFLTLVNRLLEMKVVEHRSKFQLKR